tara:strand:- start:17211 stop:18020 length:810 start_codon:yes stop_codon:yes gene_type:complete
MSNFAIIAGGGKLPILINKFLLKNGHNVFIIGIKNNFNHTKYKFTDFEEVKIGSISRILSILKKKNIKNIIFSGSIKRPSFRDISLDFEAIKLIKSTQIDKLGDNQLFIKISNYFAKKGFNFVEWYKYCPELFTNEDSLTIHKPSKSANSNLNKGLNIFKYFGKLDIGQSIIIQNNIILGLESIEGTDNLIKRCFTYKRKGDKGILLKLKKINQDLRFDLPTIGLNTIKLLKKYDYEGIFIEKKYCLILDKDKVINFANKNKIFIKTLS